MSAFDNLTTSLGGEGSDPGRAVKALASALQGASGRRLMARCNGKLVITVEKNDRAPRDEDGDLPPLAWKATANIVPTASTPAAPANPPPTFSAGSPQALAVLNWPSYLGKPGERVLLLAAQGFFGVGRNKPAKMATSLADGCRDDADAIHLLRTFKWNELADLPFPIREVLGFDKDGNPIDGDNSP